MTQTPPPSITPPKTTIVQTAEGDIIKFGDALSKFIVAHPKLSAFVSLLVGGVLGRASGLL